MSAQRILNAPEILTDKDDWTQLDATARAERKKVQNRLNQRARRRRNAKETISKAQRPYKVDRFRVAQCTPATAVPETRDFLEDKSQNGSLEQPDQVAVKRNARREWGDEVNHYDSIAQAQMLFMDFPSLDCSFSADHLLLNLVYYNVFRAVMSNKALLASTTSLLKTDLTNVIPIHPSSRFLCNGLTVIKPRVDTVVPRSLYPTPMQGTHPHSSWINQFPFPRFRENLIQKEAVLDTADFCLDWLGEVYTAPSEAEQLEDWHNVEEVDVASRRKGFIVWGEPWDAAAWELTPAFLKKWRWLLDGCEDMIEYSNYWRAKRDEQPLRLTEVTDDMPES